MNKSKQLGERQFPQLSDNAMRCSDVTHRIFAEYAITVLQIPFQGEGMLQHDRSHTGDILVVDDDHRIVDLLVELLSSAGYAARGAHDGQEALEAILAHRPALVLLDLQMP